MRRHYLDIFDSLEVLSFDHHRSVYPVHYHDTYCISIIREGVFCENELIAPKGAIVISNPNEIHYNSTVENIGASFTTFYISPDLVESTCSFNIRSFRSKLVENPKLWNRINDLREMLEDVNHKGVLKKEFYPSFYQVLQDLVWLYGCEEPIDQKDSSDSLVLVKQYIVNHLTSKINLEMLGQLVGKSKYQFTRWFKKQVGLTPFEYILLKRVGLGKRLIQQGMPLVDVSFDAGFYDQSHFSNYFKRYVGLSPNNYKRKCNIFQDF